jgi:hypothetical protein
MLFNSMCIPNYTVALARHTKRVAWHHALPETLEHYMKRKDFLLVTESDLHSMVKAAARYLPEDVDFPFLAIKKLISYRFWAAERL